MSRINDQDDDAGQPSTNSGTGPHRLTSACLRNLRWRAGPARNGANPGVHSAVDLSADALDQTLCNRGVVVAAQLLMCCRCSSDIAPGRLIHGVTIHLDYSTVHH